MCVYVDVLSLHEWDEFLLIKAGRKVDCTVRHSGVERSASSLILFKSF